ncbi:MAG: VOC family protein [bacterium]|nr:VOC family protein [bacterium]MCP5067853.1 VOC family protein [bacterium]
MQPNLTHVAIHAEDLAQCVAFYQSYCSMAVCHRRDDQGAGVVWLAEPGRESELIIVIIGGGSASDQKDGDFSHLGFAVESREQVDAIAARAKREGCLVWPPRQEAQPVGYFCGIRDPNGNCVEFSFGQPLGPGARESEIEAEAQTQD